MYKPSDDNDSEAMQALKLRLQNTLTPQMLRECHAYILIVQPPPAEFVNLLYLVETLEANQLAFLALVA